MRFEPGDGCSGAPDEVLGVDLTPACDAHDNSALDMEAHAALAGAILAAFVGAWAKRSRLHRLAAPVVGRAVGWAYAAGATAWGWTRPVRRWVDRKLRR